MTRAYTERPVWTWRCDECGFETGDLARQSYGLPSAEVMRLRGWFIAEQFGDLCPLCHEQKARMTGSTSRPPVVPGSPISETEEQR